MYKILKGINEKHIENELNELDKNQDFEIIKFDYFEKRGYVVLIKLDVIGF